MVYNWSASWVLGFQSNGKISLSLEIIDCSQTWTILNIVCWVKHLWWLHKIFNEVFFICLIVGCPDISMISFRSYVFNVLPYFDMVIYHLTLRTMDPPRVWTHRALPVDCMTFICHRNARIYFWPCRIYSFFCESLISTICNTFITSHSSWNCESGNEGDCGY